MLTPDQFQSYELINRYRVEIGLFGVCTTKMPGSKKKVEIWKNTLISNKTNVLQGQLSNFVSDYLARDSYTNFSYEMSVKFVKKNDRKRKCVAALNE